MRKLFLLIVSIIVFTSCRTIEPLNSKMIAEYNIDLTEYKFYASGKMVFEHKYSKPSKKKELDLYTEYLHLNKNCTITENNGNTLVVQFKNNTFKFQLNSKGEYEIIKNQELDGQNYKLIKGDKSILLCKVKRKTIIKK